MIIRIAEAADAEDVGRLHALSWRSAYRGIVSDDFLDKAVFEDRRSLWRTRLSEQTDDKQIVLLAMERGEALGFACAFLDADPRWGALLDNLHVRPESKGRGVGRQLMAEAAAWVLGRRPESSLYLWVYEQNVASRRFYERLAGMAVERTAQRGPDDHDIPAVRYVWRDLNGLVRTCRDGSSPPARDRGAR